MGKTKACVVTFELREVVALLRSDSRSERARGIDIPVSISTALSVAFWKDSDMVVGWMPGKEDEM